MKDLISIGDLTKGEIFEIIQLAIRLKGERSKGIFPSGLEHKTLGMISESQLSIEHERRLKLRRQLDTYHLPNCNDLQLGRGETTADTARVSRGISTAWSSERTAI